MTSTPASLHLEDVSKSYDGKSVIRKVDLKLPTGSTTVLIGPSGCGKSTLLRMMIGLITPDAGGVYLEGAEVTPSNLAQVRRRMGYVIQDGGLFPHLTARDNVSLMASHLAWPAARIEARLFELSDLTQFPADGLDRYPLQLSGGQRQRVSLMRALMLDPDVLLLDEPLGALDPMIRSGLQSDLRDIFRKLRKTVVLVTHDIGEAGFFGDRIVLLRAGRIVQQGTLQQLLRSPEDAFVTDFINAQRLPGATSEDREDR